MAVKQDHGLRDVELSRRHRLYGTDCPAVDIDHLLLEYDDAKPIALIEYKHINSKTWDRVTVSIKATMLLADAYPVPFFIAHYDPAIWEYEVKPINESAKTFLHEKETYKFDEMRYVRFLYKLRGREVPKDVIENLSTPSPSSSSLNSYSSKSRYQGHRFG